MFGLSLIAVRCPRCRLKPGGEISIHFDRSIKWFLIVFYPVLISYSIRGEILNVLGVSANYYEAISEVIHNEMKNSQKHGSAGEMGNLYLFQ